MSMQSVAALPAGLTRQGLWLVSPAYDLAFVILSAVLLLFFVIRPLRNWLKQAGQYVGPTALPAGAVKFLRVLQVLPKSTPHINAPTVGLPNASPGRQVLGTVPVEPDGSAYFQAPSGIPLAFQALDEFGQAVQTMRSATHVQPGQTLGCIGCHEPRQQAPEHRLGHE